jgi:hypothetical protein
MDMPCDHANRPLWRARNLLAPQFVGEILEEELGDSIAGSPGRQQINVSMICIHSETFRCVRRWRLTFRQTVHPDVFYRGPLRTAAIELTFRCFGGRQWSERARFPFAGRRFAASYAQAKFYCHGVLRHIQVAAPLTTT